MNNNLEMKRLYDDELKKQTERNKENVRVLRKALGSRNRQAGWCGHTGMRRSVADVWEAILSLYETTYYNNHVIRASHGEIAEWSGQSVSTVRRSIDTLCNHGWLRRLKGTSKFDVTPLQLDFVMVVKTLKERIKFSAPKKPAGKSTSSRSQIAFLSAEIESLHREIERLRAKCGEITAVDVSREGENKKSSAGDLNKGAAQCEQAVAGVNNISSSFSSFSSMKEEPETTASLATLASPVSSSSIKLDQERIQKPGIEDSSRAEVTFSPEETEGSLPLDNEISEKDTPEPEHVIQRKMEQEAKNEVPPPVSQSPSRSSLVESQVLIKSRLFDRIDVLKPELEQYYPLPAKPKLNPVPDHGELIEISAINRGNERKMFEWELKYSKVSNLGIHEVRSAAARALYEAVVNYVAGGMGADGLANALLDIFHRWKHNHLSPWKLDEADIASFVEQEALAVITGQTNLADLLVAILAMRIKRASHCGYARRILEHDFVHRAKGGVYFSLQPVDVLLRETAAKQLTLRIKDDYVLSGVIDSVKAVKGTPGKKLPKNLSELAVPIAQIRNGLPWLVELIVRIDLPLAELIDQGIADIPRYVTDERIKPYIADILHEQLPTAP